MTTPSEHHECPGSIFAARVQFDGRILYCCTSCSRVSRTKRRHRQPDKSTASFDNTMAILWAHSEEVQHADAQ